MKYIITDKSDPSVQMSTYTEENGVYTITLQSTSVDEEIPSSFTLHQNYPNPFNPETTILFPLRTDTMVTVDVYSITGQHVVRLAEERMASGPHHLTWDGSRFAAGVYLARISAGGEVYMHKMLLLK